MSSEFWFSLFVLFFAIHHFIATALDLLQIRHLKNRKDQVPAHLHGQVDPETVRRAVSYNREKLRFALITRLLSTLPLWFLIVSGFDLADRLLRSMEMGPVQTGLLFIGGLSLAVGLLALPIDLYATFGIETRYGFNRQTLLGFVVDKLKETLIGTALGGGLLALVLWIMATTPLWWLVAFAAVSTFQVLMMWLYPLLIMPLFNRFGPVADDLQEAISAMAERMDFPLKGVVQMDGSRRSTHSNAFIIGLRGGRRIVLFDTLVEKLSAPALVAVLAHELGHYRLGHIQRRLWGALVLGLGIFALLGFVTQQPGFYTGMGFSQPSAHAALVLFSILLSEVAWPFGALLRYLSRRDEYAADRFTVTAIGNGDDLKEALIALTRQNLTSPGSHRWYRAWHNSHPALRQRLKAIDRASARVLTES